MKRIRDPDPHHLRPGRGREAPSRYHLKLHPWTATGDLEIPPLDMTIKAGSVHSWQCDELMFNDPFQTFLAALTANPPTPLVRSQPKPVLFHLARLSTP
jgi:YEATS domain-containing protein 4